MDYIKVISCHVLGDIQENHETPQSGEMVTWSRSKLGVFQHYHYTNSLGP